MAWSSLDIAAQLAFISSSDFIVFMPESVKNGSIILGESSAPANVVPLRTANASAPKQAVLMFMT